MTPEYANQVAAGMLVLILAAVVGIGLILSLFVVGCLKRSRARARSAGENNFSAPCYPIVFSGPLHWIAIKSSNPAAVQEALHLHNAHPCTWDEGVARTGARTLFISPPVQGWVLVFGNGLPEFDDDVDACYRLLMNLSRLFGTVQYFSANRAVNHHAWAWIHDGHVRRAYAWAGSTLWNQGPITQSEQELGMDCLDYAEEPRPFDANANPDEQYNAERVPFLASRWSVDPTALHESSLIQQNGISGEVSRL